MPDTQIVKQIARAACIAAVLAHPAIAQNPTPPAQPQAPVANLARMGPGTIVGVVLDALGKPVDGATVYANARRKETTTGSDGKFHFEGVKTDTVTVVARRIGFFPAARVVKVPKDGLALVFQLSQRATMLPPATTAAKISGLGGVVGDTSFAALRGAAVNILGYTGPPVTTDSMGQFFVELKPGRYVVRVSHAGFTTQTVGVTIPDGGGRRVSVQLEAGADPYRNRESSYAAALRERLEGRSPVWSHLFTRDDITEINPRDVETLARIGNKGAVDSDCFVGINGGPGVPIWSLDPEDIEFMEVYSRMPYNGGDPVQPRGVTSIGGSARVRTQGGGRVPNSAPPPRCPSMVVWTK